MSEHEKRINNLILRIRKIESRNVLRLAKEHVLARYEGEDQKVLLCIIAAQRGLVA